MLSVELDSGFEPIAFALIYGHALKNLQYFLLHFI
jgi:hypothetical protein